MGIVFSDEQNNVINLRNRNILVSAAAGSGKTTVLVERIIRMISDEEHPVDIDHLLIVTFTKAAAASMREKISEAIAKKLEEHYSDHLQRQATLLHHAQITTIDSFCLFILQNNFNDIGLDPGFRVADEGEMRLLKEDVMEQLLEERLKQDRGAGQSSEEATPAEGSFAHLLDRFVTGNRISGLSDILFAFYDKALSYPFPEDWLLERRNDYAAATEQEMCQSPWMQKLFEMAMRDIGICRDLAEKNVETCGEAGGPSTYLPMMEDDLAQTERFLQSKSFVELHEKMQTMNFTVLSRKKDEDADPEVKEAVKKQRDTMKGLLKDLKEDFFSYSIEEMLTGFTENDRIVKELCDTVLDFHNRLMEAKKEKKLIDFSDMEHFALQILLRKEDGCYVPTKTALEYRKYFHEIMIDEYQDSNLVQEWLLKTISGEDEGNYNRFMVGDVKQSIYQFRMARPQIFMEKYDTYEKEVGESTTLQRIDLARNYRSRDEVVEGVNSIFYRIMGRDLGNVAYDKDSALYLGATYPEKSAGADCMELCLIEKDDENKDKKEQEARLVAHRIKQLIGHYEVADGAGGLRKAGYGDMVILLRNLKGWDEAFLTVFEEEGIPLHVAKSTGYFSTTEIRTILNFLKTLDNPKQDIPLFGTMTSWFGKFTDEEMALIQSEKKDSLYEAVMAVSEKPETEAAADQKKGTEAADGEGCAKAVNRNLAEKCSSFLKWFSSYRNRIAYEPIHKILRALLNESGYLYEVASLPGGTQRLANVQMLLTKAESFEKSSYSGLFHFIRYIEKIQKYDVEFGEAGTQDEAADVVRIMTIHKSKGLEFPVCFVSGCAGQFNMRDTESALVCDFDYGVGLDYVDLEKRVKYKDVRKRFLAKYMQEESLGEELRVLYVALTRAKEKLILTGFCKDFEKQGFDQEELESGNHTPNPVAQKEGSSEALPLQKRISAKCYLDWILAADSPLMNVKLYTTQMLQEEAVEASIKEKWEKESLLAMVEERTGGVCEKKNGDSTCFEKGSSTCKDLEEQLSFVYPHENLRELYTKTSVSELKMAAMHKAYEKESLEEAAVPLFPTEEITPYIPNFAKESREVSGSDRGSAYHRLLELLDYPEVIKQRSISVQNGSSYMKNNVEQFIDSGRMTREEIDMINFSKIEKFLDSDVALRMAAAAERGDLYKEQPFVLGVEASRLSENFPSGEKVLIQGIIDVYFIEAGEIVLLDYKTDAVKTGEELIRRYKTQIDYYTEALEKITGLKVKEKILYAFALGEVVECH